MIVTMKKLTLLCIASDKGATLEALKKLGVLHVTEVKPPEGRELDAARAELARAERALAALSAEKKTKTAEAGGSSVNAEAIVEQTNALIERKHELAAEIDGLRNHLRKAEPLGEIDSTSVVELMKAGVGLRLYRASSKAVLAAPDGTLLSVLSRDKATVYFAVIGPGFEGKNAPSSWEQMEIPDPALGRTRQLIEEREYELASIGSRLKSLSAHRYLVARLVPRLRSEVEFLSVSSGMGSSGPIEYVRGFCPEEELSRVRAAAAAKGWGLLIEEPEPTDLVPTLIRYPAWVKPVKAVLEAINVLPGYREVDISAVFLLFFSLFFGMIVGDAGYGLLLLIATILARRKMRKAPGYVFVMLGILSVCAIVWGALTGNYFGIASVPGPLKALKVDWLGESRNVMKLCFLIGAIHLTIAHCWNSIRFINTLQALAQVGWILMTWTMFFAATFFVCGDPFPMPLGMIMGGTGLALIVLFMTPVNRLKNEFIHHAMLPLTVISNFVDVVSYVRLFAVGMASVQVAQSFNTMSLQMAAGRVWAAPIVALILVGGHGLNILLSALSVLVHGIRLNTLEFSSHIGLQWAGLKYRPFSMGEHESSP